MQENIKRVQPETLELVNRLVLASASELKVENGGTVRVDCTVVESNIHHPTDSSLLYDGVRVLVRLMKDGRKQTGMKFTNHSKRAKRWALEILNTKGKKKRKSLYRDLLKVTRDTVDVAERMAMAGCRNKVQADLLHYLPLVRQYLVDRGIDGYVAQGRGEKGLDAKVTKPLRAKMACKLKTKRGHNVYRRRKHIAEPPIGWIKSVLGFRSFSLRGLRKVSGEWSLVCLALNLKRMAGQISWA